MTEDAGVPTSRINWRYGLLAVGFAAISAYRLREGDAVWATVFAFAVLANLCLALGLVPGVRGPSEEAPEVSEEDRRPAPSEEEQMRRTLEVYTSRMRAWAAISLGGWILAVVGALAFPPLGLAASVLSLFVTLRYLRFRRSVGILRRALGGAE